MKKKIYYTLIFLYLVHLKQCTSREDLLAVGVYKQHNGNFLCSDITLVLFENQTFIMSNSEFYAKGEWFTEDDDRTFINFKGKYCKVYNPKQFYEMLDRSECVVRKENGGVIIGIPVPFSKGEKDEYLYKISNLPSNEMNYLKRFINLFLESDIEDAENTTVFK